MIIGSVNSLEAARRYLSELARDAQRFERWVYIDPAAYRPLPKSTSQIHYPDTSPLSTGFPVMFRQGGEYYYGIIRIVDTGYIGIAGAPLNTSINIEGLWFGRPEMVWEFRAFVPGAYGASIANTLLYAVAKHSEHWIGPPAHLVQMFYYHKSNDGTSQPTINVTIGGTRVFSSALSVSDAFQATVVTVTPANARIVRGQYLDVDCIAAGGAGDAANLNCTLAFVLE